MEKYLYIKIYEDIKQAIISGTIQTGSRLPTEKMIMEKYDVSRITAIKAMQKLENKGFIKRIRGNGSFVTYNNISSFRDPKISINIRSKNIAFLAKCSTDVFMYTLSNFQKLAISHGYNVSIFDLDVSNITEAEILHSLGNGEFCGIVCQPSFMFDNVPEFLRLLKRNIPIVFIDSRLDMVNIPSIRSNNFLGGKMITELLIKNGHKKIGVLFDDLVNANEQERFRGYLDAIKQAGLDFDLNDIITIDKVNLSDLRNKGFTNTDFVPLSIRGDVEKILLAENRPTAFFCLYDQMAALLEQYAAEVGLKVPEDVSIVGYNNSLICDQVMIPITSVDQNYRGIAEKAFEYVLDMMEGKKVPDDSLIEPFVFERESVKKMTK